MALVNKTRTAVAARPLFLAYSLYFFAAFVANGFLGTEFSISYKTFYPYIVICALYVTSDYDEAMLLRLVRDGLLVFLIAGLLLIPVQPDLVMQKGYSGFVPGLSTRYWGLASHANNVGPLAVFFFLIVCWYPYKKWPVTMLAVTVAVVTLVLAQSKTAIAAAGLVGGLLAARIWINAVFNNAHGRVGSVYALGATMLAAALGLLLVVTGRYQKPFEALLAQIEGRSGFLTGRDRIWTITLAEWQKNPLFGYGPDLWGTEFSNRFGFLGIASNAHNQFFDTLGSAGIFGVVSLAVYAAILLTYAVRLAASTQWISVALLLFFAARCLTEVPLKTINITTSDFFMHAVVLALFMRAAVRLERQSRSHHDIRMAGSQVHA
jgi:O-antigen ligase